jgi:hypothetical protein
MLLLSTAKRSNESTTQQGIAMTTSDQVTSQSASSGTPTPLPEPRPGVIYKQVTDGGVLLSTEDEVYFGLNAVAARIWEFLPSHETLEDLIRTLKELYPEVACETLRADAVELLEQLLAQGLVETRT